MQEYKGPVEYSLEITAEKIEGLLSSDYGISKRAISLLLLQEDAEIMQMVKAKEPQTLEEIQEIIATTKEHYANPISYELALERQTQVNQIADKVLQLEKDKVSLAETLSRLTMNPITGLPILFFILYFGLYKFVGQFGAGTVVDFLEGSIFEEGINPFITQIFSSFITWEPLQDLFVGEYGMLTLGLRYALALILPIVTFFFLFFSLIEDSGYLPRLAMLIDRTFKKLGLSGRAVIPMVLGLGCVTMATMVTRTLPTRRERIIATMLLSLAIPCSAQLGVILALLQANPNAMLIWASAVGLIFLFIGHLTAKILPGERPSFYMEIPPLRLPKLSNVLVKTYVRVKWYFKEILPLFLTASFLIWIGKLTGLFTILIKILEKPVTLVGLPPESAKVFLFGFFRRDYGAAGLYDLNKQGYLTGVQLVVACVALTLFLPCIAQLLISIKERGYKTALGISLFVLIFSFSVAFILNLILTTLRLPI
jgi:ferrous iron transport protein B